jgi:hypothetical protein
MTLVTKENIRMGFAGTLHKVIIPKGTKVIPASNLPEDSKIKYWALPWKGMSQEEKSFQRNYGYGLEENEVEIL